MSRLQRDLGFFKNIKEKWGTLVSTLKGHYSALSDWLKKVVVQAHGKAKNHISNVKELAKEVRTFGLGVERVKLPMPGAKLGYMG